MEECIDMIARANLEGIDGVLSQRTAERDEARREVCQWVCCGFDGAKNAAKMRGWDCFDAKEGSGA
jgi:hypothetical protein